MTGVISQYRLMLWKRVWLSRMRRRHICASFFKYLTCPVSNKAFRNLGLYSFLNKLGSIVCKNVNFLHFQLEKKTIFEFNQPYFLRFCACLFLIGFIILKYVTLPLTSQKFGWKIFSVIPAGISVCCKASSLELMTSYHVSHVLALTRLGRSDADVTCYRSASKERLWHETAYFEINDPWLWCRFK